MLRRISLSFFLGGAEALALRESQARGPIATSLGQEGDGVSQCLFHTKKVLAALRLIDFGQASSSHPKAEFLALVLEGEVSPLLSTRGLRLPRPEANSFARLL